MQKLVRFLKDKSGASAAEYALILAIIGAAIAIAAVILGETIGNAMNSTSDCISGADTSCRAAPGS